MNIVATNQATNAFRMKTNNFARAIAFIQHILDQCQLILLNIHN